MTSHARRLKVTRERARKTLEEVALFVGINVPSYYDLENVDEEMFIAVSLKDLNRICDFLGMTGTALCVEEQPDPFPRISHGDLINKIFNYLEMQKMTVEEFENEVGFEIRESLRHPEALGDWNVDCLRFVCEKIGVDWRVALP